MDKNDIIMIKGLTMAGEWLDEGKAKLIKCIRKDHHGQWWKVKFLDDGFICDRRVF